MQHSNLHAELKLRRWKLIAADLMVRLLIGTMLALVLTVAFLIGTN